MRKRFEQPAQMASTTTRVSRVVAAAPASLWAAGVAMITMAVYAITMAPDLYSLDSPELTTAAHELGIAHAPGYPLYTLLGWLFSHAFPVSTVAFRLNLLSGILGALAVALVFLAGMRLTSRPLVAAAGALALAFSYWFWVDAAAAEVYTLDVALFAGLLLAAFAWREQRTPALALGIGLLLGLSLATRTTSALYLPALLAFAWISGERAPKTYAAAAGGMAAGLLFYAYLPLVSIAGTDVGPGTYALNGTLAVTDLATWSGFYDHVTAAQFRGDAFAYGPVDALAETATFAGWLAGSFLLIGVPLGMAGIWRLWQRDRGALVLLGGTALPVAVFFVNYGTIDKEFMFLPVYAAWALFMVAGIDWAIAIAVASEPAWEGNVLVTGAALVLPLAALAINAPLASLRGDTSVRDDAETFLAQVKPDAIVYGAFTDVAPIQYLQLVEGQRPDVKLVNAWNVDEGFLLQLADANAGVTPFYVMEADRALQRLYRLVPVSGGFEVLPRGEGGRAGP